MNFMFFFFSSAARSLKLNRILMASLWSFLSLFFFTFKIFNREIKQLKSCNHHVISNNPPWLYIYFYVYYFFAVSLVKYPKIVPDLHQCREMLVKLSIIYFYCRQGEKRREETFTVSASLFFVYMQNI